MKSRRALSTVVGAVFAIIALTSTVTYVSYSMGILDNYNQSVLTKNQQLSDVNKEKFQISSVTVPSNGRLNITVANTGSLPINFTKIWIQNTTTATTDWSNSYTPTRNFVAPGGVLTKIGQNIPVYINPTYSYNVKLVTSRGNTQQFTMNSANVAPLNIQLLALPPTIPSGFKTEIIMIVTNNGSSTLANISPSPLPSPTGAASCTAGTASPTSYNTLTPGSTAVFKWDIIASGNGGDTCTYTITTPLKNGYNQVMSATITVTTVSLTSTSYAENAGLLTMNYTLFKWTQQNSWHSGWEVPKGNPTAFSIKLNNNNSTTGTNFYISKNSFVLVLRPGSANTVPFYIVQNVTIGSSSISVSSSQQYNNCPSTNDYCVSIPPQQSATLYFAASNVGGGSVQSLPNVAETEATFLLLMGKFSSSQSGSGSFYAQNLPYLAINIS